MAGARLMQLAVLRNGTSLKNRTNGLLVYPPHCPVHDLRNRFELPSLMQRLRDEKTDLLIVDGGDGTVREVVKHLPDIFGTLPPLLGILARGNTNLIARNVGAIDHEYDILTLTRKSREDMQDQLTTCPLLRLDFGAANLPTERGFIAGWAAYSEATRLSQCKTTSSGAREVRHILFKILSKSLFQGRNSTLRQGIEASLAINGTDRPVGRRFLGLVTTLQGPLIAGFNPFWNTQDAPIRWNDVLAPAPYLLPAAALGIMGKSAGFMARNGYASGSADTLTLTLNSPIVMDGEWIPINQSARLVISAKEFVQFVKSTRVSLDKKRYAV